MNKVALDINNKVPPIKIREVVFGDMVITLWKMPDELHHSVTFTRGMPKTKTYSLTDFREVCNKFWHMREEIDKVVGE